MANNEESRELQELQELRDRKELADLRSRKAMMEAGPAKEERGLIDRTFRAIDSYTGVPARAAINSAQHGGGVMGSLGALVSNIGSDPDSVPTPEKLAENFGFSTKPVFNGNVSFAAAKGGEPMDAPDPSKNPSAADIAGQAIGFGADITNLFPIARAGKLLGSSALRTAVKGAESMGKFADVVETGEKAVGQLGKRAIQGVFGVPEEAINNYLEKLPQLKGKVGAREMAEELSGRLDQGLNPARQRLAAADAAVASAKSKRSEDLSELLIRRQEAKDNLKLAEQQALGEAASRVSSRVQQLDKSVSEGSSKAFGILDDEGINVPTKALLKDMNQGAKLMRERAITDEQVLVAETLQKYADRLKANYPKEIPGGEAKRIMQSLDREMRHLAPGEIGRLSKDDQIVGKLRQRIDAPLKESPAYAEQMKDVAGKMRVLSQTKELASESSAARALQSALKPTGKDQADILRELGGQFGDDYLGAVNRSNLPEYDKVKGLLQRYRAVKKGDIVKNAEGARDVLGAEIGDASRLADNGVAGITDNINSYVRSSNPKAQQTEALRKAGELAGINTIDELKDIKTIGAFEKSYNRGSANTNFWGAVVGGLSGSVLGPGGVVGGAAVGGTIGRLAVDNFGPAIGRKILDQTPLLKKMAPSQWIRQLDVPESVKKTLSNELMYYQAQNGTRGAAAAAKTNIGASPARNVADSEDDGISPKLMDAFKKNPSMIEQAIKSPELREKIKSKLKARKPAEDGIVTDQEAQDRFINS